MRAEKLTPTPPAPWAERALRWLDGDDPATEQSKVRAFQQIFVLIVCVEYWTRVTPQWHGFALHSAAGLLLVSALGVAALSERWRRPALFGLAIAQAIRLWTEFPAAGNHSYLELFLCILCGWLNPNDREERRLFLRSVRWMTCVVFFYAGLQKLVHGYYFHGEAIVYSIGRESFKPVLRALLPTEEFTRLSGYHLRAGDGPYAVSSPLLLFCSNATYVFEMGVVPLLVLRRTRVFAVLAAVLFVIGIESAAHEFYFGLLYVNMLLLFLTRDWNRRVLGVFAAILLCLVLIRLKVLPKVEF